MKLSTITQKGQTTIPLEIRKALDLHAGDKISFEVTDGNVVLRKIHSFDYAHHQALSGTLSEWASKEDDEAYDDL